jgi:hypothetical protein
MMLKATKDGFSMDEALNDIANSTDKAGTSLKYFDTRATATALVLADNKDAVQALNDTLLDSEGAAKGMADIMDKTLEGSMMKLKSATEGLGIAFGEILAPAIGSIAKFMSEMAMKFSELSAGTKKTIVVIAALAAAIGPLIFMVGALSTAFAFLLANPIVLAITAIVVAVGALAISMADVNDKIKEVSKSTKILTEASEEATRQISGETERVKSYYDALRKTNKGSQERADLIKTINRTYGTTLTNLENESDFVKQLDSSYIDLIKSLKTKIKLSIKEDALTELMKLEAGIRSITDAIEGKIFNEDLSINTDIPYDDFRFMQYELQKQNDLLNNNIDAQEKLLSGSFFNGIAKGDAPVTTINNATRALDKFKIKLDEIKGQSALKSLSKGKEFKMPDLFKLKPIDLKVNLSKSSISQSATDLLDSVDEMAFEAKIKAKELGEEMGYALTSGLKNLATEGLVSFGQFIGDVMSGGDMTIDDFGRGLLDSIGKFMGQFGEAMIAMGIAQTLLDVAIKSGNGPLAIIGGVALVAAGAALSNLSKKGVGGGGSTAPSPSTGGTSFNNSDNGYSFDNEITLSGRDMIITQKRERAFGR